jgi:hypothetical protein
MTGVSFRGSRRNGLLAAEAAGGSSRLGVDGDEVRCEDRAEARAGGGSVDSLPLSLQRVTEG